MAKKGGLGKGLDALFADNNAEGAGAYLQLRLSQIEPNKGQPRDRFDQQALQELADSLREHGMLQPITVRAVPGGMYQIVAGERRWRAARLAGLTQVPAIVVEADDAQVMELALIENLQRQDLSPVEEAQGYRTLMDTYHMTQEQVAQRMGKSRPAVANALRLLNLPPQALAALESGAISPGHARVLAGLGDGEQVLALLAKTQQEGLTVRQLEALSRQQKAPAPKKRPDAPPAAAAPSAWGDPFYKEMELSLADQLGTKVRIKPGAAGGTLEIAFYSREGLEALARRLSKES